MAKQVARAGWDLDLEYGKERELAFGKLAEHTRVEVKADNFAAKTGNLAIEYQQRDRYTRRWKSSGIATTEADAWVVELVGMSAWLIVETTRLKQLARNARDAGRRQDVGDGGNHRCAMVPVSWVTTLAAHPPR